MPYDYYNAVKKDFITALKRDYIVSELNCKTTRFMLSLYKRYYYSDVTGISQHSYTCNFEYAMDNLRGNYKLVDEVLQHYEETLKDYTTNNYINVELLDCTIRGYMLAKVIIDYANNKFEVI